MFGSFVKQLSLVWSLAIGATLVLGATAALAQTTAGDCSAIQFELSNPTAGARMDPGTQVLQGIALDTRAEDGPGIDRVDFFVGDRDNGGFLIGHAVPGGLGPFEGNSFQTTVTLPSKLGAVELFGYAHSSVTGQESILSLPIAVGIDPAKAGDLITKPPLATCTQSIVAPAMDEPVAMDGPQFASVPTVAQADEEGGASKMFLDVGNPGSGDTIHVGAMVLQGIAFDRAAEEGAGIDHIDVFLDDRDAGGMLIGHAVMGAPSPVPDDPDLAGAGWSAQVTLTSKMTGPHTMFFYALSGVTGEEMVVGVPVRVMP